MKRCFYFSPSPLIYIFLHVNAILTVALPAVRMFRRACLSVENWNAVQKTSTAAEKP